MLKRYSFQTLKKQQQQQHIFYFRFVDLVYFYNILSSFSANIYQRKCMMQRKIHLESKLHFSRWQDAAWAYLSESFKRNVMWYVKEDAKLGMLDTQEDYRIRETLQRTLVSRKLLAFQVRK